VTASARAAANRANAKRSTGPRTSEGKARVSRNAVRHGLNVAVGGLNPEIEDLARRLGKDSDVGILTARNAAEAQAHLIRIRTIKQQIIQVAVQQLWDTHDRAQPLSTFETMTLALLACEPQLLVLDGYERKARSRRKKAFRTLYE
jgi:hypothetical protein